MSTGNWRDNAGPSLLDPNDPNGLPIATPLDRRWLWRLEGTLAVCAGNDTLKDLARDLHRYLNETCEHHWLYSEASRWEGPGEPDPPDVLPEHWQCLWCCNTQFEQPEGAPDGRNEGPFYEPTPEEDAYMAEHHPSALLVVGPGDAA